MGQRRFCRLCQRDRVQDHECDDVRISAVALARGARAEYLAWLEGQSADVRAEFARLDKSFKGHLGMRSHGRWSHPQGADLGVRMLGTRDVTGTNVNPALHKRGQA